MASIGAANDTSPKTARGRGSPHRCQCPPIDLAALLDDEEENLKLRQINVTHASIMDLLGDPSNPLYAELHSMAEHYDAMLVGTCALRQPARAHTLQRLWCDGPSTRGQGPAGLPKDFEVPRYEGDGQRPSCANLPQDTNIHPPGRTLCTAVLRPGCSGSVCLPLPYWGPWIPTAQGRHQNIHCP